MLGKHEVDTIRQRKGGKSRSKNKDDEHVEPLDQDDQARLIQQLRAENTQHQASIEQVFGYLCITAAVVLLLSVLYLDQWHLATARVAKRSVVDSQYLPVLRALSVSHGISSALLHATTPRLTRPRQAAGLAFQMAAAVDMGVAASVLWACRSWSSDDETLLWMHYGILASNALVVLAAVLLRWDAASTDKAFADLIQAQYRFKSL